MDKELESVHINQIQFCRKMIFFFNNELLIFFLQYFFLKGNVKELAKEIFYVKNIVHITKSIFK